MSAEHTRTASRARASETLPLWLAAAFAIEFVWLAWAPVDRQTWLLENLIAVPTVIVLVWHRRRLALSTLSWLLVFAFLALHEIGSHYTYSLVPWMEWLHAISGWTPDWSRNHYDRLLHLAFGLMLTWPLQQLLTQVAKAPAWVNRCFALCVISTFSGFYELLEWGAAEIVDPELGLGFVGAQGDIWDSQKDMALALLGCCLSISVELVAGRLTSRAGEQASAPRVTAASRR